jgi:hypothetical protein
MEKLVYSSMNEETLKTLIFRYRNLEASKDSAREEERRICPSSLPVSAASAL